MANPLAGVNGPRPGKGSGRKRDTLANNASKLAYPNGYQAPISSSSQVAYGNQLAGARYDYLNQLAQLRAQRAQVGQQFGVAVTDARSAAIGNMAGTVGAALDRGVVGSSADLSNRAGVIAERQRAIADAQAARTQGRLGLASQAMDARSGYYQQVAGIQSAIAQEQMANTIAAFQNDAFDAMQSNYQQLYNQFLAQLRAQKRGDAPRVRAGVQPIQPYGGQYGGKTVRSDLGAY